MAKNDVSVSNNFYKAVAKKCLYERIYQTEETKSLEEFREKKKKKKKKTIQNAKTDLKILKQQGNRKRKAIQNISET